MLNELVSSNIYKKKTTSFKKMERNMIEREMTLDLGLNLLALVQDSESAHAKDKT